MPELPEVESIRRELEPDLKGKVIKSVKVLVKKQFIGKSQDIIGKKIVEIQRKGKILAIKLIQPTYLSIHLKLTGQLLYTKNIKKPVYKNIIPFTKVKTMPGKTTRVIFEFTDNSGLFFNDLRKFGWIKVTDIPEQPKGIDILSKDFTLKFLTNSTNLTKKPIKLYLLDQDKIAGIGNIYANDALYLAKISPLRPTNSLNRKEVADLYKAIKHVINEGLKDKGSSGADEAFILPDARKGGHQYHFLVYQQEGQPCPGCKTLIKRIKQGGRSSFYCPECQG